MRVVLICNAGLSSGLMMMGMRQIAEEGDTITAVQEISLDEALPNADVILLSPGIRYLLKKVSAAAAPYGAVADVMDMRAYGQMDGPAVYRQAKELYEASQK